MPMCLEQTDAMSGRTAESDNRRKGSDYSFVRESSAGDWKFSDSNRQAIAAWRALDPVRGTYIDAGTFATEPNLVGEDTERNFARDLEEWRSDTRFSSNLAAKLSHPAYLRIIALGREVLPLILKDLRQSGGHWFVALRAIAREDPVPPEHRSLPRLMREDWLRWGVAKGLLDGELDVPTAVSGPDRNAFSATQD